MLLQFNPVSYMVVRLPISVELLGTTELKTIKTVEGRERANREIEEEYVWQRHTYEETVDKR